VGNANQADNRGADYHEAYTDRDQGKRVSMEDLMDGLTEPASTDPFFLNPQPGSIYAHDHQIDRC
jgi:hypothetical protein